MQDFVDFHSKVQSVQITLNSKREGKNETTKQKVSFTESHLTVSTSRNKCVQYLAPLSKAKDVHDTTTNVQQFTHPHSRLPPQPLLGHQANALRPGKVKHDKSTHYVSLTKKVAMEVKAIDEIVPC